MDKKNINGLICDMTDEEISEYFKLSEYYFGDETVDDAVKFEKYLNTPPSNCPLVYQLSFSLDFYANIHVNIRR